MKVFTIGVFLLCVLLSINACQKDSVNVIDFSEITPTDETGALIGQADTTDWTYDAAWTSRETALMTFNDTALNSSDSVMGAIAVSPAFPNANDGLFIVGIEPERQCKLKYVFVNSDFNVLNYGIRKLNGGPTFYAFDFRSNTAFDKGANYRMYYGFYNSKDSLYYKGHGDIKIE